MNCIEKVAIVWVITILLALLLALSMLFIGGCSEPLKERDTIKPEVIDYRARWMALAIFAKQHFETDKSIKWIAADLSLAAYRMGIE